MINVIDLCVFYLGTLFATVIAIIVIARAVFFLNINHDPINAIKIVPKKQDVVEMETLSDKERKFLKSLDEIM